MAASGIEVSMQLAGVIATLDEVQIFDVMYKA